MSARPAIGALRHRVTIEAPVDVADDVGGFVRSFNAVAQVWAHVAPLGASDAFIEQRLEQSRLYAATIRWRSDVAAQMRFDFRGRKLVVRTVEDMGERRRFLNCGCEEIA